MDLGYDPVAQFRSDGDALLEAAQSTDLERPVTACPEWNVADLTHHVGEVWRFWATIASDGITSLDEIGEREWPARPSDSEIVDWSRAALDRAVDALTTAQPDREVWTWTGANRDVAWVRRRMAQETAVHRFDAELAAGTPATIDAAVAADGIDEFLMWHAARQTSADGGLDGPLAITCADTDHAWTVRGVTDGRLDFLREIAPADCTVSGSANAVLLWLWQRDGGPVTVSGNAAIAEQLRSLGDAD